MGPLHSKGWGFLLYLHMNKLMFAVKESAHEILQPYGFELNGLELKCGSTAIEVLENCFKISYIEPEFGIVDYFTQSHIVYELIGFVIYKKLFSNELKIKCY